MRARYQARMDAGTSFARRILAGPPCEQCGGQTRIVAIMPHQRLRRRHVWKLECLVCETPQTADMPAPQRTH